MKKRFEVEVIRTDKYIIEIDDEVITEDWMEQFRNVYYDFDDLQDHAEHVAQARARFYNDHLYGGNIEGYGDVALGGKVDPRSTWPLPAINIVVVSEDDVETEVRELEEKV